MSKILEFPKSFELKINPTFRDLIPPLADHEREGLEEDIKHFGCQCPITTWNGFIIDGHHRYEICTKHKLIFTTEEREFETQNDAEIWIIQNQFNRRNLPLFTRGTLVFELERRMNTRRGENQHTKENGSLRNKSEADRDREEEPFNKAAKAAGMGHDSYAKCKFIDKHATEEEKQKLHKGEVSTNKIYNRIKTEQVRAETIAKLEAIENKEAKAAEGTYDVVVLDPPWEIAQSGYCISDTHKSGYKPLPYPTMTVEEIKDLELPCADDCHVFLWTTQQFLPIAFKILDHWGLEYACTFAWTKNGGVKPPDRPMYNTEFCIYARQGKPKFIDTKQFFTTLVANRGKHSEKPEEFYDLLRRVTAGRRIDMFNRRSIEGFDVWGNESQYLKQTTQRGLQ